MPVTLPQSFGGDVDLSAGDFTYNEKGQQKYATGITNLQQAIARRLLTNPGSLLLHPEYGGGLGKFVDRIIDPLTVSQIKSTVRDQVLLDPRIESVLSITVTSAGSGVDVFIQAITNINQQVVNLNIPIVSSP